MAAPTLGEAIALQGVTKPADNFGALVRGMQVGEMFKQRRQAGDAKVQKMISDGIALDSASFPTRAHYERAKKDTEEYMMKARELREKVGDNRFLNDPDFQQAKTNYLYGIENLKADSKNAAELIKLKREGKIWLDDDYERAANSSWDEYAAYKNDITGEGVDPVSRRSNVTAVPKGDLAKVVKERFDPRNEALYNQKGEQRRYGGVNDYGLEYWVDPKQKMAIIEQIVVDHPELAERYLKMDKQNVDARAKQILQEAAAKGMEVLDINKARAAAAKEFLMRDADKYIQQYVIKDIRVPEPKSTSGGDGGAKRKDKFQYTPTTIDEVVKQNVLKPVPETGGKWSVMGEKIETGTAPFVSVQYASSETDNKPLDLPVTTDEGEVLMEISPLGFTKVGNDWVFMGKNEVKYGGETELQDRSINMTTNKKAAARIANYFGYDKVSDYTDFLDKKAGVQSKQDYGNRPNGTKKGNGYLGVLPIKHADGTTGEATEYSTQSQAVKVNGKQIDFPTLVPTLTKQEVDLMVNDIIPNKKEIPEAIMQKAITHAKNRIASGKSVFADEPTKTAKMSFPEWKKKNPNGNITQYNEYKKK